MARRESAPDPEPQLIVGFLGTLDIPDESWTGPLDNFLGNQDVGFIFPSTVRIPKARTKARPATALEAVYDFLVNMYEAEDLTRVPDLITTLAEHHSAGADAYLIVLPDGTPETAVAIKEAGNAQITVLDLSQAMDEYSEFEPEDEADSAGGALPDTMPARVPLTDEAAAEDGSFHLTATIVLDPEHLDRIADAVVIKLANMGLVAAATVHTTDSGKPAAAPRKEADGTTAYYHNTNTDRYRLVPAGAGRPRRGEVKEFLTNDEVAEFTAEGKISDQK